MEKLKQSEMIPRVTPATPGRDAMKRRRKGPDAKQGNRGNKQPPQGRDDGHRIDEFA